MKSLEIVSKNTYLELTNPSPCHLNKNDISSASNTDKETTLNWLNRKIETMNLKFHYFLTLSFYRGTDNPIYQYLDNKHIKNVILDYFYPNNKPKDKIRLWFFIERHKLSKKLHVHILMEGVNGLNWLSKNNRKIILHKKTLLNVIANDYCIDDLITEGLTNHLKSWVNKLGQGKKSTKFKEIGNKCKRVNYINKSLDFHNLDFDGWEHIDYENSDL